MRNFSSLISPVTDRDDTFYDPSRLIHRLRSEQGLTAGLLLSLVSVYLFHMQSNRDVDGTDG